MDWKKKVNIKEYVQKIFGSKTVISKLEDQIVDVLQNWKWSQLYDDLSNIKPYSSLILLVYFLVDLEIINKQNISSYTKKLK